MSPRGSASNEDSEVFITPKNRKLHYPVTFNTPCNSGVVAREPNILPSRGRSVGRGGGAQLAIYLHRCPTAKSTVTPGGRAAKGAIRPRSMSERSLLRRGRESVKHGSRDDDETTRKRRRRRRRRDTGRQRARLRASSTTAAAAVAAATAASSCGRQRGVQHLMTLAGFSPCARVSRHFPRCGGGGGGGAPLATRAGRRRRPKTGADAHHEQRSTRNRRPA